MATLMDASDFKVPVSPVVPGWRRPGQSAKSPRLGAGYCAQQQQQQPASAGRAKRSRDDGDGDDGSSARSPRLPHSSSSSSSLDDMSASVPLGTDYFVRKVGEECEWEDKGDRDCEEGEIEYDCDEMAETNDDAVVGAGAASSLTIKRDRKVHDTATATAARLDSPTLFRLQSSEIVSKPSADLIASPTPLASQPIHRQGCGCDCACQSITRYRPATSSSPTSSPSPSLSPAWSPTPKLRASKVHPVMWCESCALSWNVSSTRAVFVGPDNRQTSMKTVQKICCGFAHVCPAQTQSIYDARMDNETFAANLSMMQAALSDGGSQSVSEYGVAAISHNSPAAAPVAVASSFDDPAKLTARCVRCPQPAFKWIERVRIEITNLPWNSDTLKCMVPDQSILFEEIAFLCSKLAAAATVSTGRPGEFSVSANGGQRCAINSKYLLPAIIVHFTTHRDGDGLIISKQRETARMAADLKYGTDPTDVNSVSGMFGLADPEVLQITRKHVRMVDESSASSEVVSATAARRFVEFGSISDGESSSSSAAAAAAAAAAASPPPQEAATVASPSSPPSERSKGAMSQIRREESDARGCGGGSVKRSEETKAAAGDRKAAMDAMARRAHFACELSPRSSSTSPDISSLTISERAAPKLYKGSASPKPITKWGVGGSPATARAPSNAAAASQRRRHARYMQSPPRGGSKISCGCDDEDDASRLRQCVDRSHAPSRRPGDLEITRVTSAAASMRPRLGRSQGWRTFLREYVPRSASEPHSR